MNKNVKHIAFYVRKVNEHMKTFRQGGRKQNREQRLTSYKAALNKRLRGGDIK